MARWARFLLLPVVIVGVAACGDDDNEYVEHSGAGLYMRLPHDWEIFETLNNDPTKDPRVDPAGGTWRVVFDGATSPDRAHLEEASPNDPVGFVEISPTPTGGPISHLALRSVLIPVGVDEEPIDPLESADFDVLDYEEFDTGSFYGNRLTADTNETGGTVRLTQIAAVNAGSDRVYLVVLMCSVECYEDEEAEIEAVLDSFTLEAN